MGLELLLLTHRLGDCNFFPNMVCVSLLVDSFPGTCCCSPHLLVLYADTFWDGCFPPCCKLCALIRSVACCNSLGVILATIGPRTTQELFPLLSCNCCLIDSMQWLVFRLCREQGWGLVCLIKLVAGNHTDRARGLAFFSITPE